MRLRTMSDSRCSDGSVGLEPRKAQELTAAVTRSSVKRPKRFSALAIGVAADRMIEGMTLTHAAEPGDVIEMLRVLDFSLLIVSAGPKDIAIWKMVDTVRRYWPRLRWVLLSEDCGDREEILARSLGASSVTADPAVIMELASNRRRNSK